MWLTCVLSQVDAHANDHIVRLAALAHQGQLGENAAQFAPVQVDVVEPLDAGGGAAGLLHGVPHRHGHPAGEGKQLGQLHLGAQQQRQIEAAGGRGEGAAPGAPPGTLLQGGHHGAVGGALGGHGFQTGVGGVHPVQDVDVPGGDGASQHPLQIGPGEGGGRAVQPIAQAGGGGDGPALFPQLGQLLPHGAPGHAQLLTHLLAGEVVLGSGQQGNEPVTVHGHAPSSWVRRS